MEHTRAKSCSAQALSEETTLLQLTNGEVWCQACEEPFARQLMSYCVECGGNMCDMCCQLQHRQKQHKITRGGRILIGDLTFEQLEQCSSKTMASFVRMYGLEPAKSRELVLQQVENIFDSAEGQHTELTS